jgi:hypothetical protein
MGGKSNYPLLIFAHACDGLPLISFLASFLIFFLSKGEQKFADPPQPAFFASPRPQKHDF